MTRTFAIALLIALSQMGHPTATAAPLDQDCGPTVVYCPRLDEPADPTVRIEEDSPLWDCRTMGNLECGVGNSQGVPAGDYGDVS